MFSVFPSLWKQPPLNKTPFTNRKQHVVNAFHWWRRICCLRQASWYQNTSNRVSGFLSEFPIPTPQETRPDHQNGLDPIHRTGKHRLTGTRCWWQCSRCNQETSTPKDFRALGFASKFACKSYWLGGCSQQSLSSPVKYPGWNFSMTKETCIVGSGILKWLCLRVKPDIGSNHLQCHF